MTDEGLITALRHGALHRFVDFHSIEEVPKTGAGVYTIWNDQGDLVYVGIAGRNMAGKGLHGRLKSHYQGRRSGDQFCVYVADRYVLAELTGEERDGIVRGEVSMDRKVRAYVREHFSFRIATTGDYASAIRVENAIKRGALGRPPKLNP